MNVIAPRLRPRLTSLDCGIEMRLSEPSPAILHFGKDTTAPEGGLIRFVDADLILGLAALFDLSDRHDHEIDDTAPSLVHVHASGDDCTRPERLIAPITRSLEQPLVPIITGIVQITSSP
jgi:hypothetical protein